MQTGRGRGNGPRLARVDRLIARQILGPLRRLWIFRPCDVGRQWRPAVLFEQTPDRCPAGEPHLHRTLAHTGAFDLGLDLALPQGGPQTGALAPSAAAERLPPHRAGFGSIQRTGGRSERLQQQELDLAAGVGPPSLETRGKDTGVVDDHQIARAQIGRQIGETAMPQGAVAAVEHQHPRGRAFGRRMLRDPFGWQEVVVVGGQ